MNIAYDYEIISSDEQARCMEVRYTSPGRAPVHVSARLPYLGESLAAVIAMYSPVAYWRDQAATVVVPAPGTNGSYTPPEVAPTTLGTAKQVKRAQIAEWRYDLEVGGVLFNGATIRTDRESQAQLTGAFSSLKDGLIPSVDWKTAEGGFITLGLPEVSAIAAVVAQHVQGSFTQEKALVQQVEAATTIEEVNAVVIPTPQFANMGLGEL